MCYIVFFILFRPSYSCYLGVMQMQISHTITLTKNQSWFQYILCDIKGSMKQFTVYPKYFPGTFFCNWLSVEQRIPVKVFSLILVFTPSRAKPMVNIKRPFSDITHRLNNYSYEHDTCQLTVGLYKIRLSSSSIWKFIECVFSSSTPLYFFLIRNIPKD